MSIEKDLKDALARREPPVGFAGRMMARLPKERSVRSVRPKFWNWRVPAAAALLLTMGGGLAEYQRRENQRRQGERATAELIYALDLASQKLSGTRAKVLKRTGEL